MIHHYKKFILLSFFLATLIACISENRPKHKQEKNNVDSAFVANSKEKINRIRKIFLSLPSPIELTYLFKKEGVEYQKEKLHNIAEKDSYILPTKKALNLGLYGANLSYAGLFGKHQDAIEYFATSQLIADELGVGKTFQKEFISRIENNADNKDTLLQVVTDFFLDNDSYLRDLDQQDISTFILLGGWIEGLYLGTEMTNDFEAEGVKKIIIDQSASLDNLILLLGQINHKENDIRLIESIHALQPYFNLLKNDSDNNDTFLKIKGKVAQIRASIIQK